jgi:hypothetical protein
MSLIWKLLRQHISVPQFLGFFFANLVGMFIVLLGCQFYADVMPVFTSEDSFMRHNYVIVSKSVGAGSALSGRSNSFTPSDTAALLSSPSVKSVGAFSRAEYNIHATMGIQGNNFINTELFLESVPDQYVDVPLSQWQYAEGSPEVPIILPRSYLAMYNFGFAQTHGLPKISDGVAGMLDVSLFVRGNGREGTFRGKVIGFSSRLNTILVPERFILWSNGQYAPSEHSAPSRLIMEVDNPAGEQFTALLSDNGLEQEDDNRQAERMTYFLRIVVVLVMAVGLVISALSFYILMLSIWLLVQKNAEKLENLLLLGYSPRRTALPYQLLTVALNAIVLIIALLVVWLVRGRYLDMLQTLSASVDFPGMQHTILLGLALLLVVSFVNIIAIRRKVAKLSEK